MSPSPLLVGSARFPDVLLPASVAADDFCRLDHHGVVTREGTHSPGAQSRHRRKTGELGAVLAGYSRYLLISFKDLDGSDRDPGNGWT